MWLRKDLPHGIVALVTLKLESTDIRLSLPGTALTNQDFTTPEEVISFVDKTESELLHL